MLEETSKKRAEEARAAGSTVTSTVDVSKKGMRKRLLTFTQPGRGRRNPAATEWQDLKISELEAERDQLKDAGV